MHGQQPRTRASRRAGTNARKVPLRVEALEPRCLLATDVVLTVQEAALTQPPEPGPAEWAEDASSEPAVSIPADLPDAVVSWPEVDPSLAVDPRYDINVWVWDFETAMQESLIPLPYWRSMVGGDGSQPESEDSVGPIAFCSFPGFDPFFKEHAGDPGIDALVLMEHGEFGEIGTFTEIDGPEPCFFASFSPEVLLADMGSNAPADDAIPSLAAATTAAEDSSKPRPPVIAAFASLPGAYSGSGFAGFGAAASAGDAAGDAGSGVRRRIRR